MAFLYRFLYCIGEITVHVSHHELPQADMAFPRPVHVSHHELPQARNNPSHQFPEGTMELVNAYMYKALGSDWDLVLHCFQISCWSKVKPYGISASPRS
uniref:Uncharacterized protein n=1 Tax=Arundo donax TaxID=35708 RepID=A0A0A9EL81_ARUDO